MIKRILTVLSMLVMLAGCSTTSQITYGDQARFAKPNMRIDKILTPAGVDGTVKELFMLQAEFIGADGKPLPFQDARGNVVTVFRTIETANSLPFVREFILGTSPGAAVAFINGRSARSVADIGKCGPGANCGTVNNISTSSAAQSLSQTQLDVTASTGGLPCARANNCAALGN